MFEKSEKFTGTQGSLVVEDAASCFGIRRKRKARKANTHLKKIERKHIMKKFLSLLIVAACSVLAVAANWPPSIIGTWQGTANQSTVKLVITSQGTTGACKAINGTLSNLPSGG